MIGIARGQVAEGPGRPRVPARVADARVAGKLEADHFEVLGDQLVNQGVGPIGLVVAEADPVDQDEVFGRDQASRRHGLAGTGLADAPCDRGRDVDHLTPSFHGDPPEQPDGRTKDALPLPGWPGVWRSNLQDRCPRGSLRRPPPQDHLRLTVPPAPRPAPYQPQHRDDHESSRDQSQEHVG